MNGFGAYCETPYLVQDFFVVPNAIQQLLEAGVAEIVYAMALDAQDEFGNVQTLYLSNRSFATNADDTPADQYFEPLLRQPISFRRSLRNSKRLAGRGIFRSGQAGIHSDQITETITTSGAQEASGEKALLSPFGAMPFGSLVSSSTSVSRTINELIQDLGVDGQDVEIRWGSPDLDYEQMLPLYSAKASGWQRGRMGEATLSLRGTSALLDNPLMDNRYDGSGGVEGGDDLKNKPKPVGLGGKHVNVNPPQLDKFSDGTFGMLGRDLHNKPTGPAAIASVDFVSEDGVEIPLDTSVGDNGDLATAADLFDKNLSIESGKYAMTLAEGKIRLGSNPAGLVTVDFASKEGPAGQTMRKLAEVYGGLSTAQIDTSDFDALDRKVTGDIELWFGTEEEPTVAQVFDQAVDGFEGWWGDSRRGQIRIGKLTVPSQDQFVQKSFDQTDIIRDTARWLAKPDSVDPAVDTVRVGHTKVYAVQDRDVAASVDSQRETLIAKEYRIASRSQTVNRHEEPKELRINSVLTNAADAQTLGDEVLPLYAPGTRLLQFRTGQKGFDLEIERDIGVTLPRAGIDSEVVFRVIGLNYDARRNETTIIGFAGAPE